MPNYVPGIGPSDWSPLMFVGEAPGAIEDYNRQPFVGPTGQLLDEICREIGIDRRSVYITNVIKYRPPENKLRRYEELGVGTVEQAIDQLWEEINARRPNCIVGFGNLPLKALTGKGDGFKGIMKWRGSILKSIGMDFKVVPTIHPAALLHADGELEDERKDWQKKKGPLKYSYRHILKLDLIRAREESESPLYNPPERVIEIAKDAVMVQRFFDLYKDKKIVSVDIEVVKAIPYCIGIAFNEWHAMSIPLLDVFSWQNLDGITDHQLAEMWMLVAELLDRPDILVIGQNFKFDQRQLMSLCGIRIRNFYCDTSLLAHSLHPEFPKALQFTTSIYTREPYYKDEGKEFNWGRDKVTKLLNYNGRDACVTFEIFAEMLKDARELVVPGFPNWVEEFVFGHQMSLHNFYYDLENVGFLLDPLKQQELIAFYNEKVKVCQDRLNELAGWEVNVESPKQTAVLVYNQLKFPLRKGTAEEVLVALIANTKKVTAEMKETLERIMELRRLHIAVDKISARCDYDGRMRTIYTISGTETGRSSTKILKPPVRPEQIGMQFHALTKHGEIGTEVREMLVADKGYVIVETDMSQAEARIVALLGNDYKLLEMFNKKQDIHKITAAMIFGVEVSAITKDLRFIGKTARHAGHYGMKKHRCMELVNTEAKRQKIDINISEWRAGVILEKFHKFSPNVQGVFQEGVKKALQDNNHSLVNPFGRYRQFFDRWGEELWKEAWSHIPQSTVPDAIRRAGIRAKKRFVKEGIDARFVVEAHDALVGLVREDQIEPYRDIMHEEIERPIDFSRCSLSRGELIIPAETKIGKDYKNLHDYTLRSSLV
jgi:uracil-DNA glycosylase family 4